MFGWSRLSARKFSFTQTLLLIGVVTVCSGTMCSDVAFATDSRLPQSGVESSDPLTKLSDKTNEANRFLQELIEKLKDLDDYEYESEVYTYGRGTKPKAESGRFFFKKENRVRVESTSGKTNGSIVVRRKDGLVRAKAGPMLLGITMTLHEDSALLNAGDGTNVLKSDLLSQMVQLKNNIRAGSKGLVSAQPIANNVIVMDVCRAGTDEPEDRVIVNAATGLPAELIHYVKGAVFARTMINSLKVNSGIADSLFEL